ncbi:transcription termination/antitermination protein NusA, partial [Streptomyces albidoflavus]
MDIDMSALRGLVREKEISFDLLVEAIESALLIAYHRTEGTRRPARVGQVPGTRPRYGRGQKGRDQMVGGG